jgi:hypothetical protein
LEELAAPTATIGVIWAGIIPYYSELPAIDFLGKADPVVSRLPPDLSGAVAWWGMSSVPGHNKYDLNYSIKTLLPDYVQQFEWGMQDLTGWAPERYDTVTYRGVQLHLLRGSPRVSWSLLAAGQ